jgi:flagellar biosynthesis protein FliP
METAAAETLSLTVDGGGTATFKLFLLLTVLSFLPGLLLSLTCFARIVIVLSFLRQAIGTPQLPPNPILVGLALFLTLFIMRPTLVVVYEEAIGPFLDDKIDYKVATERAEPPLREFMLRQTREEDLRLFQSYVTDIKPTSLEDVPFLVVVPAFLVSELTTAFTMALQLFLPFILIDLLVSAVLMALGMMMVPPTMISLPVKLGVFVMADGWSLVIGSLARSFT